MTKRTVYRVNIKCVGLSENIVCFQCGKMGHYRYGCLSRMYAMNKSLVYAKQVWVRKDELSVSKGMGPCRSGFPQQPSK